MNEQRKDVLDMLAEGKITAEEAERLLAALEGDRLPGASSLDVRTKGRAKYLRVMMDDGDNGGSGRINVRVPLQLLRAGVRLAALVPPQVLEKVNAKLSKSDVPFDLTQLKPEHLEALVDHLDEVTVEIDDADAKIRVFCE
ncbi:DUF2089 domain-containing protein [Nocardia terpenica]|uniref:SHOCT-like domain-containing protein n=1 Tax=Nocardia terpenica TaxID=455432 RepID=UPI002FE19CFF